MEPITPTQPTNNESNGSPPVPSGQPPVVIAPSSAPTQPQISNVPTVLPAEMPFQQPPTYTNPTVPGNATTGFEEPPKSKLKLKLLIPVVALFVLLLGGGAAAYFGYYQPNQPENVWGKALNNTGKGYNKLSDYLTEQAKASHKGFAVKGSFKVSGGAAVDGTFEGKNSGDDGEYKATVSAAGAKVNVEAITLKSSSVVPDLYFKVDGLQGLGTFLAGVDPELAPALNGVNGQWYFIDHSLFNQISQGADTNIKISPEDVTSILKAVGDASETNIFTSDKDKMAFTIGQYVGKEKLDNHNTYHYKAVVSKQRLKDYVDALCTNLKDSNLKKFFKNDSKAVDKALDCASLKKSIDETKLDKPVDVWVDAHTKLIYKIRFSHDQPAKGCPPATESSSTVCFAQSQPASSGFTEVGQDYQGGDEFPFFINTEEKHGDTTTSAKITIKLNTKTDTLALTSTFKDSDDTAGSFDLTVSANDTEVKPTKPANAKNIIELLNDLGIGDIYGSVQNKAKDTERKTDINALTSHLEVYNAQNGFYPSLAQLNDKAFVEANMKGLPIDAFQDPDSGSSAIVSVPTAHAYAYQASPAGCGSTANPCTGYTLTATLDDGTTYVKTSLN